MWQHALLEPRSAISYVNLANVVLKTLPSTFQLLFRAGGPASNPSMYQVGIPCQRANPKGPGKTLHERLTSHITDGCSRPSDLFRTAGLRAMPVPHKLPAEYAVGPSLRIA